MENDFNNMEVHELEAYLKSVWKKLADAEDELDILREQSNSGQHISSKRIQTNMTQVEQEIESLKSIASEIKREMENRKNVFRDKNDTFNLGGFYEKTDG